MRRAKLILVALALVVSAFAAFSGPAMADDPNCHNARGDLIRCDGELYTPYNDYTPNYDNYYPYMYNNYSPYDYGMTSNNDYGVFGPCGLFGVFNPYTGACDDTFGS